MQKDILGKPSQQLVASFSDDLCYKSNEALTHNTKNDLHFKGSGFRAGVPCHFSFLWEALSKQVMSILPDSPMQIP